MDFVYSKFVVGGFDGDMEHQIPAVAVYSPSLGVLVETDPTTDVLFGPPEKKSIAYIGDDAERRYADLSSKLSEKGIKPTEIELPREFSVWGRALERAQHPDQSIVNLLTPKR